MTLSEELVVWPPYASVPVQWDYERPDKTRSFARGVLTTEPAHSHSGQPVLVVECTHQPDDPFCPGETYSQPVGLVYRVRCCRTLTAEEKEVLEHAVACGWHVESTDAA